ncbi:unnamed protein product [Notodromas monacha]|uniref:Uncharacterized protein n=1 Tax=Notodromas monacha TaxID=399045 RepID=A0A7R9GL39_9CRUS|nr:unnamed protein product [Notodromas monacha]CAG0925483.1 unnamed protein product [Notodromas monacha]
MLGVIIQTKSSQNQWVTCSASGAEITMTVCIECTTSHATRHSTCQVAQHSSPTRQEVCKLHSSSQANSASEGLTWNIADVTLGTDNGAVIALEDFAILHLSRNLSA